MKVVDTIVLRRLSTLQLAEALGNIVAARRQQIWRRSPTYEDQWQLQTRRQESLHDQPPIPKSHPLTPPEVVKRILQLNLERPV